VCRRPVDHEQVDLIGQRVERRRRVPGRIPLERGVHDLRAAVERLAAQQVADERRPFGVVLDRHDAPGAALAQKAGDDDRAHAAAAFDHARAATVHHFVADRHQAGGAHRPRAPRQVAAGVQQRAEDMPGMEVLRLHRLVGEAGQAATAWSCSR